MKYQVSKGIFKKLKRIEVPGIRHGGETSDPRGGYSVFIRKLLDSKTTEDF
jgi:hypothetical protein